MITLAIDTSGPNGSIALLRSEERLAGRTLQLGQAHGQSLIPGLNELLESQRLTARDCELVAVSVGPGSFTGLRVGIVCAKTWAYATDCRAVGVSTFAAIACNAPTDVSSLQVVSDAQRGDLFVGKFTRDEHGDWKSNGSIEIVPAVEWASRVTTADTVTGPAADKMTELLGGRCRILPLDLCTPQAVWIGRLGFREAAAGRFSDLWLLEPLYLRRSSAEDKWDALQAARQTVTERQS